jgi:integrase
MPRKAKWPPVPTRHKSGLARVNINGDIYLGPFGSPEAAAELARVVREEEARRAALAKNPPGLLTVNDAALRYVEEELPLLSAKAQALHRRALSPLCRLFGTLAPGDLDCDRLEDVRTAMTSGSWLTAAELSRPRSAGARPGPLNRRTANCAVRRVLAFVRWAERRKLFPAGSWAALRALPPLGPAARGVKPVPRRKRFTDGDVIRAALAIPRSPCRLILLAALWSGARPGEVRTARWSEIDRTGAVWFLRPAAHKCAWRGQTRAVPLGPKAQAVLLLARRLYPRSDLVFPSRRGGPVTDETLAQAVRKAAIRAGVPGLTCYCGRHLTKDRVAARYGLTGAKAVLGHASVGMTAAYGAEVDEKAAAEIARVLG